MTSEATPKLGRPRLHEPEEVREWCIGAGIELLRENGLAVGLTGVTIEAAAARHGFSRASAYRAWRNDDETGIGPQQRFQQEVVLRVISSSVDKDGTVDDRVLQLLFAEAGTEDLGEILAYITELPAAASERLFARVVAAGTTANRADLADNQLWHAQISLTASLHSRMDKSDQEHEALIDAERVAANKWVQFYQLMLGAFGIRMKPHYDWPDLALAAASLTEGMTLRQQSPEHDVVQRPIRTLDGGKAIDPDTHWTLFGVAAMGLITEFCEADPDVAHGIDPHRC